MEGQFEAFQQKMDAAGQSDAAIKAFERSYGMLVRGESALIQESSIEPVTSLPMMEEEVGTGGDSGVVGDAAELLGATVMIKLNGGLGTGMGLETAKSLLRVRDGLTFLDLIARQILGLRERHGCELRFLLMNSYTTSGDTLSFLDDRYAGLGGKGEVELMQSRVPKVNADTKAPAEYGEQADLEWCPPGHGDLYPSLLGTGWLDLLLAQGVRYAFVSNSDNLGATLDPGLLAYFAESGAPFLMEVTRRTVSDRKGGHLAMDIATGRLRLRELAQCEEEDVEVFQDIERHRFFNTNNIWFRLDRLKEALDANEGILPLPVIQNRKTVNPREKESAAVYQLETAMGAAVECFDGGGAIVVPRSRFAPVKTTDDLLAVRSDAYELTEDSRLVLAARRMGTPPVVKLDPEHYKLVDQLEGALTGGVPSLIECEELCVEGPVGFSADSAIKGTVVLKNGTAGERRMMPEGVIGSGEYEV